MRRFTLIVLALIFLVNACGRNEVEQIKVIVPPGIVVPDDMVYIPAGEFIMGHPDESTTHGGKPVYLDAFLIDRFEVTREQFKTSRPEYSYHPKKAHFPVSLVTFGEAETYCRLKDRRLPTEAEWEKAARGTDGRKWPWKLYQEHPNNGFSGFLPEDVDRRKEWTSPYGVYGMGYNIWEWTSSGYTPEGLVKSDHNRFRAIRGGLTQTHLTVRLTPTWFRNRMEPTARFNFLGFRCAKNAN